MKPMQILMIAASILVSPIMVDGQSLVVKSYTITVQGTSSLHDWESKVEKADIKGSYTVDKNVLLSLNNVAVRIPVTSLKSPKGKMMDSKTYEAFDSEKNPSITFTITGTRIAAKVIEMTGTLSMAGVTRPVEVKAAWKVLENGDLQVSGSHKLNMTDFKMEPPTAMMGTVRVGEEVTVQFDVIVSNSKTTL